MSVQEIHQQLEKLTPEELAEVENHIRILRVISAPGYRERITAANRRLDAGGGVAGEVFEAKVGSEANDAAAR